MFDGVIVETDSQITKYLVDAKGLIKDENFWCQGKLSGWSHTKKTHVMCSIGALEILCTGIDYKDNLEMRLAREMLNLAARRLGYFSAFRLNDHTDHATVMEMYDLAIEMSRNGQVPDVVWYAD